MDIMFGNIFLSLWKGVFYVFSAFAPLFYGLILAYLLNSPVEWVRQKISKEREINLPQKSPKGRGMAILITYFFVLIILVVTTLSFLVLMIGALPSGGITSTIENLYDYFDSYYRTFSDFLNKYLPEGAVQGSFNPKETILNWLTKYFSAEKIIRLIKGLTGGIVNLFLGIVASIYLLKDKEFFLMMWQKFLSIILKQRHHGITNEIIHEINIVVSTFLKSALVDSLIVAFLSAVVLTIINIKYAAIIGIIGGILNVIPYFGPFLAMIPAFLISITTQGLLKTVITLLALFAVQQLDSNYIYPKIVGASTGLHPLFILLSVSVMGYFLGVVGMLLAVPIAGIIQVIIKKWIYSI